MQPEFPPGRDHVSFQPGLIHDTQYSANMSVVSWAIQRYRKLWSCKTPAVSAQGGTELAKLSLQNSEWEKARKTASTWLLLCPWEGSGHRATKWPQIWGESGKRPALAFWDRTQPDTRRRVGLGWLVNQRRLPGVCWQEAPDMGASALSWRLFCHKPHRVLTE